ncbi:MAG: AAA family ATPase [Bacilli bacterium]|nr:AAA family ATPase [Bacilli bacterium]MDD4406518.1 AAA family ATPase [Bacilli bacterium]
MTKTISLVNQKGGVGKTTTSINLAASLGKLGKKVLLIDLDPQGNTTTGLGINKGDIKHSIYDVLNGNTDAKKGISKTKFKNLSIIPATINLAGLDIELVEKGYQNATFKKNEQLRNALLNIKDNYEFIIIDCPPSLGLLTTNALVASDSVIIPVQCEFFALEGITQLLNTIIMTQTRLNPNLKIEGVLLTLLDSRTNLGLEVVEEVKKFFKEKVFNTIIPRLIRLVEAPSHGEPINEYDPTSRAAEAYLNLAKEVIDRNGN